MNLLALKKDYKAILTEGDEYLLFNKENNTRLNGKWRYDENNNIFGYYLKRVWIGAYYKLLFIFIRYLNFRYII